MKERKVNIALKIKKCLRCGHEWMPRVETPTVCPYCMSPYWNKPRDRPRRIAFIKYKDMNES